MSLKQRMKFCSGLDSFVNDIRIEDETMLGLGFILKELEIED
jgi:hypothetical protein